MAKSKAKPYPPAYYRYREKHPTVSIVLSKETKDALDKVRSDMSYAKFLTSLFIPDGVFSQFKNQKAQLASERVSLKNERTQLETVKKNLENERKKLDEIERFTVPCPGCGESMEFKSTDSDWNNKIKPRLAKTFCIHTHKGCGR
jgi:hypothetical protein